jgi:adenylylsulfate kinase
MLLIQLTGLSGAGKTTLANAVKEQLLLAGYKADVIDGDVFRQHLCKDLSFSRADRETNISRLGIVANLLAKNGVIALMAAINPYETSRAAIRAYGSYVKTVWVHCDLPTLIERDTKGLYKRALLPNDDPNKVTNLTGINNAYDIPIQYDLRIDSGITPASTCTEMLVNFILQELNTPA